MPGLWTNTTTTNNQVLEDYIFHTNEHQFDAVCVCEKGCFFCEAVSFRKYIGLLLYVYR